MNIKTLLQQMLASAALVAVVVPTLSFAAAAAGDPTCMKDDPAIRECIKLIQPLDDDTETDLEIKDGLMETWFDYFSRSGSWLYYTAVGICVLWCLIGGFHIIVSGADQSTRQKGVDYMTNSIIGLVILMFAPVVLRVLNNMFFK